MTSLQEAPVPAAAQLSAARRWAALGAMSTAQLIVVLDSMIMLIALPAMQRDIGISEADGQWVLTAYALAIGCLLLLGGRIADFSGRRRAFMIGLIGFTAASTFGGIAVNTEMLLAARVLQGAFAALLMPAALSLLSVMFVDPKERAKALAVWSAIGASGMVLGLVLGGFLTEYASWRWCLLINAPIGLIALVVGALTLTESKVAGRPRYDLLGTVTGSAGLFLLVYGLSRAGTDGWGDTFTVGSLVGSVVVLGAFLAIEHRVTDPLMPLRLVLHRNRAGAFAAAFGIFGLMGMWLFIIYFLQGIKGYSAIEAGLTVLPYSLVVTLTAALLNQWIARANQRLVVFGGLLWGSIGAIVMGFVEVEWNQWTVMAVTAPMGVGIISSFIALSGTLLTDAGDDAGAISALFNVMQQIGTAFGAALLTTVALERTEAVSAGPVPTPEDLTDGYGWAFWGAAVILVIGATLAFLLLERTPGTAAAAVPAPGPARLGVSGIVSAAGGAPLPGVALTLVDWSGREVSRTSTDHTGRYHLDVTEPGDFLMVATPQSHQPTATVVSVGHSRDLVLNPAAAPVAVRDEHPFTGSVRSADTGLGIPGAMVTLIGPDGEPIASTDTDLDGGFGLVGIPAGTYTVTTTLYREVTDTVDIPIGDEAAVITLDRRIGAR